VNTKTARAMVAFQEYADAAAKVAEAVEASLEVVEKWGRAGVKYELGN
jgi:hypothetical protein